ncbi:Z1 domain-containing protein [Kineosporia sp. NBRC 101731]|uniref:Z1 domain-containing protein n=1 Tax=Kineosporia sp. NBRC 101731 TaxID=3032199 RepID=UPI0025523783|nr:Z1 domain-containing protein [Kineosporia sp. NBRC 101731]
MGRFSSAFAPEILQAFEAQWKADLEKVENGGVKIIAVNREPWYAGPHDDQFFWPALASKFKDEGWDEERINSVDSSSSTVVAHTPNPVSNAWKTRGLVVGYVQSGKTTNFTAVVAKLADVEYRMVIVLSGIHNGLRQQTQLRLNEYLVELNDDNWVTMTSDTSDFVKPTSSFPAMLGKNKVVLAVVKKNVAVLKKLIQWLEKTNARKALETAPVLVIDDEADQASVATGRINPLIRRLLELMPRSTYIGYTATPFANVFIDPSDDQDLYPRSFILNLPRPVGYFGPEKIFGRDTFDVDEEEVSGPDGAPPDGYDMVRHVPETDVPLLRPGGRESAEDFVPTMTTELKDAVHWFWLATAARRARKDLGHSTMLIHTSLKIAVHESYRPSLESMRDRAVRNLQDQDPAALDRWRVLWEKESARVPTEDFGRVQNSFEEVLKHLLEVLSATRVILDNFRSADRLDYSDPSVVAIAVGGNTLSRGLTLEGLVVSFFIRAARAYDTLLQMGRWFGYRTGYEDLPRIWTTPELASSFRHLALVEHEMRDDIDRYQRENLTPQEVAVRIRTHPSLLITAKMGAAQPAFVSFEGRRLQTRYFRTDDAHWLEANRNAADTLVNEAMVASEPEKLATATLLRDVPVSLIKAFLNSYQVHGDSPDLDHKMLLRYINARLIDAQPSLEKWSVALVDGDAKELVPIGGLQVSPVQRARLNDDDPERADIKTLMSKQDRVLDLGKSTGEARAMSEDKLVEARNADPVHRDRGLLVLYAIDKVSAPSKDEKPKKPGGRPTRAPLDALDTVIGLGIVFPGDRTAKKKVQATHVAVDLTDVESDDVDAAMDMDTEEAG